MNKVRSLFSLQSNGFLFVNHFQLSLPIRYRLPFGGEIDLRNVAYGLCGGMCFAALDYFHAGKRIPLTRQVDEMDPRLFTYLRDRQLDSLSIATVLKLVDWMLSEDAAIATRMKRYDLPRLRRMLDSGEPAALLVIRVRGLSNPTLNHQVVATGYDLDPLTQIMTILLYDPNHPNQDISLIVDLKRGAPVFIRQSSGEPLRGFFILPYRAQSAVPDLDSLPFGPDMIAPPPGSFRLRWPVDSRRINQYFGENPDLYRAFKFPGHEGLDLFALTGENVYAAASGEVYQANYPSNHPYGRQVRIKHLVDGKTYHTVYAHLASISVQKGQMVQVGEKIGQADSTGNSWGSHVHLTLKIDGEKTPGYPAGIVDPLPYLLAEDPASPPPEAEMPEPLPPSSGISIFTSEELNLRTRPGMDGLIITRLPSGEYLMALGSAETVRASIGKVGDWLPVRRTSGQLGFVAAEYVQSIEAAFPPSDLVIYPFDTVNLRSGPTTGFDLLATLTFNDPLIVLGDADMARAKLGRTGEWLQVQTETGQHGFVAAWLVHATGQTASPCGMTVYPGGETLNVRARPMLDGNILTVAAGGDALSILGDKASAIAKIGVVNEWLNVRTPTKFTGYVAAWLVIEDAPPPISPVPADNQTTIYAAVDLNLRAQPAINSPRVGGIFKNEPFTIIETDAAAAVAKVGRADQWIFGQKQDGERGWAAAWFMQRAPSQDA